MALPDNSTVTMVNPPPLVIGLDCSTSACKAVAWDCRGNAVARGYSPLSLITPQPTWHEQSADSWWTATVQALRQVVSQVDGRRLRALCIAHQRETFVPVDAQGRAVDQRHSLDGQAG